VRFEAFEDYERNIRETSYAHQQSVSLLTNIVAYLCTSSEQPRYFLLTWKKLCQTPPPLFACVSCREADRKAGFLLKNTRFSTDPTTGLKLFSAR